MSDITVTLDKNEYDKMKMFNDKIMEGQVAIAYDYGHYNESYYYCGLKNTIKTIKDRDSKYIQSLLQKTTEATDKRTDLAVEINKLNIQIVNRDDTISGLRLLYDEILNKKQWWKIW